MSRELSTPFGRCLLLTSRRPFPEQDPVILHLRVPRNKTFLSLFVFPEGGELGLHYNYWVTDVLAKRCGFFWLENLRFPQAQNLERWFPFCMP